MSLISVQVVDKSPLTLSYIAATSVCDSVLNTTAFDVVYNVKNDSSDSIIVNISAIIPCEVGIYDNVSTIVYPGTIGIFPLHSKITSWSTRYNTINYSSVSDITVAAYRILR